LFLAQQFFVTISNLYLEKSARVKFLHTKTMERSIRENVDLKKTLNFLPDGVIVLDSSTKQVKFINNIAENLFQVPHSAKEEPQQDRLLADSDQEPVQEQRQEFNELHELCLFKSFEDSVIADPLEKKRMLQKTKQKEGGKDYSLDDLV